MVCECGECECKCELEEAVNWRSQRVYDVANVLSGDVGERNSMSLFNEEPNLIFLS